MRCLAVGELVRAVFPVRDHAEPLLLAGGRLVRAWWTRVRRPADDAATVSKVTLRFNSLRSEALPKGASRELIVRVAEERWKGKTP